MKIMSSKQIFEKVYHIYSNSNNPKIVDMSQKVINSCVMADESWYCTFLFIFPYIYVYNLTFIWANKWLSFPSHWLCRVWFPLSFREAQCKSRSHRQVGSHQLDSYHIFDVYSYLLREVCHILLKLSELSFIRGSDDQHRGHWTWCFIDCVGNWCLKVYIQVVR